MSQDTAKPNYKDTLNLPQTDFPMRADLVKREPLRLEQWEKAKLYEKIQEKGKAADAQTYILHDGPPFANGDVHMGTAINKTLKDLIMKSKTMAGYRCPYVPGWDCHGLPIEFKVVKESKDLSPLEIRKRSEEFARGYIDIQRQSFRRLGVLGDWDNPYLTLDPAYESEIIRAFGKFVENDLVYRDRKPVLWSYGAGTALAEAEVDYEDKKSMAVFVRFAQVEGDTSFVIWTTTPWTLPANSGIALNERFDYTVGTFVREADEEKGHADFSGRLIIATDLLESFTQQTGLQLDESQPVEKKKGAEFLGQQAQHPFLDRQAKVIHGDFVTTETGTGAVHIAPGHGQDDYVAGQQNGLNLYSPVDDEGLFTEECGLPQFVGIHVFKANAGIITMLEEGGVLLGKQLYEHQYPHCWRSKTPIIFRSVFQYFIRIDEFREQALEEIDKVDWLPHWARNRIHGTVESRPDWCISRQRSWGVPLPVFYNAAGEAMLDAELIEKVAQKVQSEGSNLWFEKDDAWWTTELGLPEGTTRGQDTLDVWIDSGCSHLAVLDQHPELSAPADLYLEATDQHRGWFQSSLMIGTVTRGEAPYKSVLTHGFVVDTSGKKISKSDTSKGKPKDAKYYYDKYGADMIRLWAASVDFKQEVPFSEDLFTQNSDVYRRIRNTLRILLGNLYDFDIEKDAVEKSEMTLIDRWILERLHALTEECVQAYADFEFRKAFIALNQFCANDLSSLYIDMTKDRLYCDEASGLRRRSAQTAMHHVVDSLCRLLAPVLAYTADEAWEFLGNEESVHLQSFPVANPDFAPGEASEAVEKMLSLRGVIQKEVEAARQAGDIGSNVEAAVTLKVSAEDDAGAILDDAEAAAEFFIVSNIAVERDVDKSSAVVSKANDPKCPRCWRHLPVVGEQDLCGRCDEATA